MSILSLRGVTVAYGSGRTPALEDVDLDIDTGGMVALIGPNGAGKSTLLRAATGVLRPRRGQVLLQGRDVATLARADVARTVAVVPQSSPLPAGLRVGELIELGRTPYLGRLTGPGPADRAAVAAALSATSTSGLAMRFVDELSGGEYQRVLVARALAQEPRVLLLDEPTANLDLRHQVAVLELVRGLAQTQELAVLAAVHDLQLAALYFDRLVLLRAGRVLAHGPPESILIRPLLEHAFAQRVELTTHPTHGVPLVALVPAEHARRQGAD